MPKKHSSSFIYIYTHTHTHTHTHPFIIYFACELKQFGVTTHDRAASVILYHSLHLTTSFTLHCRVVKRCVWTPWGHAECLSKYHSAHGNTTRGFTDTGGEIFFFLNFMAFSEPHGSIYTPHGQT